MSLNTPFEPWLKRKRGLISEAGHAAINRQWIKVGKVFVVNCSATWTSLRTGVKTLIARNYMKWFYQYINRQNEEPDLNIQVVPMHQHPESSEINRHEIAVHETRDLLNLNRHLKSTHNRKRSDTLKKVWNIR